MQYKTPAQLLQGQMIDDFIQLTAAMGEDGNDIDLRREALQIVCESYKVDRLDNISGNLELIKYGLSNIENQLATLGIRDLGYIGREISAISSTINEFKDVVEEKLTQP